MSKEHTKLSYYIGIDNKEFCMPYRLTTLYTRKGDEGYTSINDKPLSKDDLPIEVVGTLDELNSQIGMVIALGVPDLEIETTLTQIQHDLFDIGGEMHLPDRIVIQPEKITWLENQINQWNAGLPPLKEFLLPRGTPAAAACHIARTVCRRAERCLVRMHRQIPLQNPELIRYLNRLSDLLFVISRIITRDCDTKEVMWEHPSRT